MNSWICAIFPPAEDLGRGTICRLITMTPFQAPQLRQKAMSKLEKPSEGAAQTKQKQNLSKLFNDCEVTP